jgi:hypothetical protein
VPTSATAAGTPAPCTESAARSASSAFATGFVIDVVVLSSWLPLFAPEQAATTVRMASEAIALFMTLILQDERDELTHAARCRCP